MGKDIPAGRHCLLFGVLEFLLQLLDIVLEGLELRADVMQFGSLVVDGDVLIADLPGEFVHLFAEVLDFPVLFSKWGVTYGCARDSFNLSISDCRTLFWLVILASCFSRSLLLCSKLSLSPLRVFSSCWREFFSMMRVLTLRWTSCSWTSSCWERVELAVRELYSLRTNLFYSCNLLILSW